MTNEEILNRFDVLYNNITSSQAPGLDGYEKSVFWNKATLEVLKNHLNPKGNKYGEGFDFSSKRQVEFSSLVKTADLTEPEAAEFCMNATRFAWRNSGEVLSILNEYGLCEFDIDTHDVNVGDNGVVHTKRMFTGVPINHVEYDTLMSRPYKLPPKSQCWRMYYDGHIEVVSDVGSGMTSYHIRYIKLPAWVNLESGTGAEVPDLLHDEILQRAVELAKAAYVGDMNQQQVIQALGERSE